MTISLSFHFSYFLQLLDIKCFSVLKRRYSQEIEVFIKAHINHIMKAKFFIAFQKVYNRTMTKENIKTEFSRAGLFSYNL